MYIVASINLVGQREKLTGQVPKLAGKCPVTDCYYEHWYWVGDVCVVSQDSCWWPVPSRCCVCSVTGFLLVASFQVGTG